MIHFTLLAKDWPGGQEEQGHGLILRDDKNNYYDSLKSVTFLKASLLTNGCLWRQSWEESDARCQIEI